MIVGIGVDLVDIPRFERQIARTPRLLQRLFTPAERALRPRSLAARYAAKEALIKALGGSDGVHWSEMEIAPDASGRPWFRLGGTTADTVAARRIRTLHVSLSHDANVAVAYVVAESEPAAARCADIDRINQDSSNQSLRADGFAESRLIRAPDPVASARDDG